jgi:hypothetical protein
MNKFPILCVKQLGVRNFVQLKHRVISLVTNYDQAQAASAFRHAMILTFPRVKLDCGSIKEQIN